MRDGAVEQSTIFEVIGEDRFQEIQIRNRFGIFQNELNYKQNAGSLSKSSRRWNGDEMPFGLLVVTSWFIRLGSSRLGATGRSARGLVGSARCRRCGSGGRH